MNRTAYKLLKKDIAKNGQCEEIVMLDGLILDGLILDGRGRFDACLELGIAPNAREFYGADPLAFSISKISTEGHLNESRWAQIAVMQAHRKQGYAYQMQNCGLTHAEAAAIFGVSLRQVDKASALRNAVESAGRERRERQRRSFRLPLGEQHKFLNQIDSANPRFDRQDNP
jgi:hypothetical protein